MTLPPVERERSDEPSPSRHLTPDSRQTESNPNVALAVTVLGFFVITLDAVIVNVALPSIEDQLGGGISGMQWVIDGYTLMFAALLLPAGVMTDRIGARRAFTLGVVAFAASSAACGLAPNIAALVAGRFVQGAAAAVLMPSSMALIRQAFPNPQRRAWAIGIWAMGGAVAASSGPILGGALTVVTWRLIFVINVPVGIVALLMLLKVDPSPRRNVPVGRFGPILAVVAMGTLIFGTIEAGVVGLDDQRVVAAFTVALATTVGFVVTQRRSDNPMVPPDLVKIRNVSITSIVGFAFVAGYFGLPFVMSLFLQQHRSLSPFQTGLVFLPMMLVGTVLIPFSARAAEHVGARRLITGGLLVMAIGLGGIGLTPASAPIWVFSALMAIVGLAGPPVMPPATAVLLNSVPGHQTGTASGIFNTSRQIGGALAIAVFGALLAPGDGFLPGFRASLFLAAAIATLAALASRLLQPPADPVHA